jgi:hypothetical protein
MVGDDGKVYLGDSIIFDVDYESMECFGGGDILYSPAKEHYLFLLNCFEGDNQAVLIRAHGSEV